MAIVEMKCPNCGSPTVIENGQFVCKHCGTMLVNIVDAKINDDAVLISAEEFAKKIEESKQNFIVRIDDKFEVFDVNTKVINKKIKDGIGLLEQEKYNEVLDLLKDIDTPVLSVERLRYLAYYKARNEYELLFTDGYINGYNFKKLLKLCDAQTEATYKKIETFCRENYDKRIVIKKR